MKIGEVKLNHSQKRWHEGVSKEYGAEICFTVSDSSAEGVKESIAKGYNRLETIIEECFQESGMAEAPPPPPTPDASRIEKAVKQTWPDATVVHEPYKFPLSQGFYRKEGKLAGEISARNLSTYLTRWESKLSDQEIDAIIHVVEKKKQAAAKYKEKEEREGSKRPERRVVKAAPKPAKDEEPPVEEYEGINEETPF